MKKIIISWRYLLLLLFYAGVSSAQQPSSQPLPHDPAVRIGTLKNGLTYYVRKNTEPRNRAELRLVVKAGSILETEAQQGLAHFMEHMNFNGTVHFPKNELVSYLQSAGVKFGADLNAYTGFDETVYMLPIPTDSAGLLEKGLVVLQDWAHGALLEPEEIEKERGVVLEESRMGRGARQRMQDQYFKVILNNSRYAERLPIGKDEIIRSFKPATLREFYKDWYRPDLMAVIAVGDFDPDRIEQLIKEGFSAIPVVRDPKKREAYRIPLDGSNKVAIVTDREYPQNLVQLIYKLPRAQEKTYGDLREQLIRQLYNAMMGQRMAELTRKADPPFLVGFSNSGRFLGDLDSYTSLALAKEPGGVTTALTALVTENERVRKFGFTATELERSKKSLLVNVERTYKERDKSQSGQFASTYTEHFLQGKAIPGIAAYFRFVEETLPAIRLEEVNALSKKFLNQENMAVVVMAPESGKALLPDEKTVRTIISGEIPDLTPYNDEVASGPLLPVMPEGAPVVERKSDEKTGVTELVLGNGARVFMKPTDFKNDQILFKATSPGGASLHQDHWITAQFAAYVVQAGGVGNFSSTQLQKYLAGKTVSVRSFINTLSEGVTGSTTPGELETALQLLYAGFTFPRKDPEVVRGILANQRSYLVNQQNTPTPEKVFSDTLNALLTNYSPLEKPLQPEDIDKIDLDKAFEIYKTRFSDASNFAFTFVGNFEVDAVLPLIEKYIGGLRSTGRKDYFNYPKISPVPGHVEKVVFKGVEPKSSVSLNFTGDYAYTPGNNVQLEALAEILEIRLLETLREEESGVYGVGVNLSLEKYPYPQYSLSIGFGCAPENVARLIGRTKAEIDRIKKEGAAVGDIVKFVAESRRKLEVGVKTNSFWLGYIDNVVFQKEDLHQLYEAEMLWKTVTPSSTRETSATYLNEGHFVELVLKPER